MDTFPPAPPHFVEDGNQFNDPASDIKLEDDWFDDGQLEESAKKNPSKVMEALSLKVGPQSFLSSQAHLVLDRDPHGRILTMPLDLSQ